MWNTSKFIDEDIKWNFQFQTISIVMLIDNIKLNTIRYNSISKWKNCFDLINLLNNT